jgi:hypothetical protein
MSELTGKRGDDGEGINIDWEAIHGLMEDAIYGGMYVCTYTLVYIHTCVCISV